MTPEKSSERQSQQQPQSQSQFHPPSQPAVLHASAPIILIEQAAAHAGQVVTIQGWLYNLRESGKLLFPIFRDGTGIMQGVVSLKEQPDAFAALKGLPQESSVDRKSTRL